MISIHDTKDICIISAISILMDNTPDTYQDASAYWNKDDGFVEYDSKNHTINFTPFDLNLSYLACMALRGIAASHECGVIELFKNDECDTNSCSALN